jgi:hypothetical protein
MNIKDKRDWVRKAYSGKAWEWKVDQMSDKQIEALFIKFRKEGKINV